MVYDLGESQINPVGLSPQQRYIWIEEETKEGKIVQEG